MALNIFIIEDADVDRNIVFQAIEDARKGRGIEVVFESVGGGDEFWEKFKGRRWQTRVGSPESCLFIIDVQLPEGDFEGLSIARRLLSEYRGVEIIIYTKWESSNSRIQDFFRDVGYREEEDGQPLSFLTKRPDVRQFKEQMSRVFRAFESRFIEGKRAEHSPSEALGPDGSKVEHFVGPTLSPVMDQAFEVAGGAGADVFDDHVLIWGESGSGKDYLSRYVHDISPLSRGKNIFIRANCQGLDPTHVANLLLGVREDAYTGVAASAGLVELADGGTLFLDEIGHFEGPALSLLLNILDPAAPIRRLGGGRPIRSRFRVIAATNEPWRLPETIWHRFPLKMRLPALSEWRPEERVQLAEHLWKGHCQRRGRGEEPFPEVELAEDIRSRSDWDGNVRQLSAALLDRLLTGRFDLERHSRPRGATDEGESAHAGDSRFRLKWRTYNDVMTEDYYLYWFERHQGAAARTAEERAGIVELIRRSTGETTESLRPRIKKVAQRIAGLSGFWSAAEWDEAFEAR